MIPAGLLQEVLIRIAVLEVPRHGRAQCARSPPRTAGDHPRHGVFRPEAQGEFAPEYDHIGMRPAAVGVRL